eukprot:19161-Rhodomonas_salina.3
MSHKARHIDTWVASAHQVAESLIKSTPKLAFEKDHNAMLGMEDTGVKRKSLVIDSGARPVTT